MVNNLLQRVNMNNLNTCISSIKENLDLDSFDNRGWSASEGGWNLGFGHEAFDAPLCVSEF